MATVIREIAVDAPAAQCWGALRDFGALHERLVTGFVTNAVMTVLPDELADRTAGLMEAGLKAMKATLEGAMTPA